MTEWTGFIWLRIGWGVVNTEHWDCENTEAVGLPKIVVSRVGYNLSN